MLVAILSDIHSNPLALDAVLKDAASKHIKTFWCLGDVVGYGPWPVPCWVRLRNLAIADNAWVVGNHELGLVNGLFGGRYFSKEYFDGDAERVLHHHRQVCQQADPSILEQIKKLKFIAQPRPGVILSHGAPKPNDVTWTVTKYTQRKTDADQAIENLSNIGIQPQVIVVGHTHKAIFWRRVIGQGRPKWEALTPRGEIPLGDPSRQTVYLNPGSVGQPRDDGRKASYCYIDWNKMMVCFRRVPYKLELVRQKMTELEYPHTLIEEWYSE
jgi:predicted phosphodiesterase